MEYMPTRLIEVKDEILKYINLALEGGIDNEIFIDEEETEANENGAADSFKECLINALENNFSIFDVFLDGIKVLARNGYETEAASRLWQLFNKLQYIDVDLGEHLELCYRMVEAAGAVVPPSYNSNISILGY